jgi:hypothetical protein
LAVRQVLVIELYSSLDLVLVAEPLFCVEFVLVIKVVVVYELVPVLNMLSSRTIPFAVTVSKFWPFTLTYKVICVCFCFQLANHTWRLVFCLGCGSIAPESFAF